MVKAAAAAAAGEINATRGAMTTATRPFLITSSHHASRYLDLALGLDRVRRAGLDDLDRDLGVVLLQVDRAHDLRRHVASSHRTVTLAPPHHRSDSASSSFCRRASSTRARGIAGTRLRDVPEGAAADALLLLRHRSDEE